MKNFVSALSLLILGLFVTVSFTGCGSVSSSSPVTSTSPTPTPVSPGPSPTPTPVAAGTFVFEDSQIPGHPAAGFRLNSDGTLTALANSPLSSSTALAVSGNFLIAAQNGMIVSYRIDPATGNLTTAGSGDAPSANAVAADGKNVYAAGTLTPSSAGTGIYGFSISASGALTPLPGSPYFFSVACTDICDSPLVLTMNDNFVVEAGAQGHGSGSVTAYPRGANGVLGAPHTGFDSQTLAKVTMHHSGGNFVYATSGSELSGYVINTDGTVAHAGPAQFLDAQDVVVDATGKFLLMLDHGGVVHVSTIDPATGNTSQIGTSEAAGNGGTAIAMDPSNQFVLVSQSATSSNLAGAVNQITVFTFDSTSGAMKKLQSYPLGSDPGKVVIARTQ